MNNAVRKHMARVPMTDVEAAVVRQKAEEMGIPIARLIRRCVFGVDYEIQRQVNPHETTEPTIELPECKLKVAGKR